MRHVPKQGFRDPAGGGGGLQSARVGGERKHAAGDVRSQSAGVGEAIRSDTRVVKGGAQERFSDIDGSVYRIVSSVDSYLFRRRLIKAVLDGHIRGTRFGKGC